MDAEIRNTYEQIAQLPAQVRALCEIDVDQVDYLFHRLFAMIQLMLRKKGKA